MKSQILLMFGLLLWTSVVGVSVTAAVPFGAIIGADLESVEEAGNRKWKLTATRQAVGQIAVALPPGADAIVLPAAAGVYIDTHDAEMMAWLRGQSPLGMTDALTVPFVALQRGTTQWVYAVADPYYAALSVDEQGGLSIVFTVTPNRQPADLTIEAWPVEGSPIDAALSVRAWLQERGQWKSLREKIEANPRVERLLGAPHFYLFGSGVFSWHDVPQAAWPGFGRALRDAESTAVMGRLYARMNKEERDGVDELADGEWASVYAKKVVARAVAGALVDPALTGQAPGTTKLAAVDANRAALAAEAGPLLAPLATWGDGVSLPMLDRLRDAGVDRAVLTVHDLDPARFAPRVAAEAERRGYLFGPYDSYGSIHAPDTPPDQTWETAQFDQTLYDTGMIVRADGTPYHGFNKVGRRLSPLAAWPWVQKRVDPRLEDVPYSAWFLDVDSFGEFFDDYHPDHPATKPTDAEARRRRMAWLSDHRGLVVGSEGASAVMTGPLHYAHGVQTPHYGWGDERLKNKDSEYGLGNYWPPDTPTLFFKPTKVLPDYRRPWFTPTDRLPLFAAVFGDAVVATHHWENDSLKYPGRRVDTALLELLYNVPPLIHLNRETWKQRGPIIARRFAFQSPLHRRLATAPLTDYAWLSEDRLLQRTTFTTPDGEVRLVANFSDEVRGAYPAKSLTVEGSITLPQHVYRP